MFDLEMKEMLREKLVVEMAYETKHLLECLHNLRLFHEKTLYEALGCLSDRQEEFRMDDYFDDYYDDIFEEPKERAGATK